MIYHLYLSNTFTCSSEVTFPHIQKELVRLTFPPFHNLYKGALLSNFNFIKSVFLVSESYNYCVQAHSQMHIDRGESGHIIIK